MSNFWLIHFCGKRLNMFDAVDTAFSNGRALIVCKYLQKFFKVKEGIVSMKSEMQILRFHLVGQT